MTDGTRHDDSCLAAHARDALCRCKRHDWLHESVPRHQARRELLQQLASWAGEQRALADAELRNQTAPMDGRPGWAQQGVRAAASMASEVYVGVRRTALSLLDELPPPDATPRPQPAELASEDTAASEPAEREVAGRFLERWAGRDVVTVPTQGVLL